MGTTGLGYRIHITKILYPHNKTNFGDFEIPIPYKLPIYIIFVLNLKMTF